MIQKNWLFLKLACFARVFLNSIKKIKIFFFKNEKKFLVVKIFLDAWYSLIILDILEAGANPNPYLDNAP